MHDRIVRAMNALSRNPRPPGCRKVSGSENDWRIRVGDYRVIYEIADANRIVRVNRIRHRREAYRSFRNPHSGIRNCYGLLVIHPRTATEKFKEMTV
ncbi:MAG: hypothetical protein DME49_11575 [Verrucomicrobia bacterium]|nr:MAG: hypothetical protein DME49_11575 [Verrucomicrobiota bacterium]PYL37184.1 MAG: hypothetical protein DMF34_11285 [Verrucomicrobiota bacterium]